MPLSKTVNNYDAFLQEAKLEKNEDKQYLDTFFKRKFIIFENGKIIHPKVHDLHEKISELMITRDKLKGLKKFWEKEKDKAENYYKNIKVTKFFKTKFWRHKLKQTLNQDYREDVQNSKLTDEVLMDPAYNNLLDTFLVDYDYRKKLCDTVSKSIIYKDSIIGDHNKKRQQFKKENAQVKIDQTTDRLILTNQEILAYQAVIKYIKIINK